MNKRFLTLTMTGLLTAPLAWAAGEHAGHDHAQDQTAVTEETNMATGEADKAAQPVEVGNKICPVSNEKVGQGGMEAQKVTYKGKVYNLCCAMCEKDFNKDPEKYSKIAEDEVRGSQTTEHKDHGHGT